MLVIGRRLGQGIEVTTPEGRVIRVTVQQLGVGKVRLGFESDREVAIWRDELLPREDAAQSRRGKGA